MTYKKNERFALNHHAGFFKLNLSGLKKIDLEYFSIFYQSQLQDMSVSTGSSTLSLDQIYKIEFEFPSYYDQIKIMQKINPLLSLKKNIMSVYQKILHVKGLTLSEQYTKLQVKDIPINKILNCKGGNSGLTEEAIYQKSMVTGKRYDIISASIDQNTRLGTIPLTKIRGKKLKPFENRDGILIVRVGKSGSSFFLKAGKYVATDNTYILYLNKKHPHQVNLKWLMYQLKSVFLQYAPAQYGAWNMTGFFNNVMVDVPILSEQLKAIKKYEKLEDMEKNVKHTLDDIHDLLNKQVSVFA